MCVSDSSVLPKIFIVAVLAPCYGFGARHVQILLVIALLVKDRIGCEVTQALLVKEKNAYIFSAPPRDEFARKIRNFSPRLITTLEIISILIEGVAMFLGGYLSLRVNNKYLVLVTSVIQALACLSLPPSTLQFGIYGYSVVNTLYFFCRGFHKPITFNIVSKWIPSREISRCVCYYTLANGFGSYFSGVTLPLFHKQGSYGIFILQGAIQLMWCAVYFVFGTQDPRTCFYLSDVEKEYLGKHLGNRRKISLKGGIPWKDILKTPLLYGFIFSYCSWCWERQLIKRCIDSAKILPWKERMEGKLTAILIYIPLGFLAASLSDWLISREKIVTNNMRKIFHSITSWGSAICCLFIGYSTSIESEYAWYILNLLFSFLMPLGFNDAVYDASPNYASLIFGIASALGNFSIACEPVVASYIVQSGGQKEFDPWNWLTYLAALIKYVANYAFLMAGNINLKKFDAFGAVDWRKDSILSYP